MHPKILPFLQTQTLGVISTIDDTHNAPESAVVAFSQTEALELVFGTFASTRKFVNILKDPRVAFTMFTEDVTVQYEGVARMVKGEEAERCRQIHVAKNPASAKYSLHPEQRFFLVKPVWIRYTDLSKNPEEVWEGPF